MVARDIDNYNVQCVLVYVSVLKRRSKFKIKEEWATKYEINISMVSNDVSPVDIWKLENSKVPPKYTFQFLFAAFKCNN